MRNIRTHIVIGLLLVVSSMLCAQQLVPAGITADKANPITEPTMLTVQSGSNYIRFDEERLPAVVTYIPSAPFGTIPTALATGDTIEAELVFAECSMAWLWSIEKGEGTKIVEIKSHEDATILAVPHMCTPTTGDTTATACESFVWHGTTYTESAAPTYTLTNAVGCDSIVTLHLTIHQATKGDTTATACESFVWHGTTYTESAAPTYTLTNAAGCDSIVTLYLTIEHNCGTYQTAYFCSGFNTEHDEPIAGGITLRYRPYIFESPADWDYMEGVIVEREHDRTLLDLHRAEENLHAHYSGELTPISSIRWSVMYDGKGKYVPLTVTDEPQWIAAGQVAVQIYFLCGQMYNTEFPTDIDEVSTETVSSKRIENGRVVIIRGGAKYDVLGTRIH